MWVYAERGYAPADMCARLVIFYIPGAYRPYYGSPIWYEDAIGFIYKTL